MATALVDIATLADSGPFISRVTAAVLLVGADVIKTVIDSGNATGVDKARMRLAKDAIADPVTYGEQFARVLAVQPGITDATADTQILSTVTAAWNYLAEINL